MHALHVVQVRKVLKLSHAKMPEARLRALWHALDESGDGQLQAGEFGAFMRLGEPVSRDRDGKSAEPFSASPFAVTPFSVWGTSQSSISSHASVPTKPRGAKSSQGVSESGSVAADDAPLVTPGSSKATRIRVGGGFVFKDDTSDADGAVGHKDVHAFRASLCERDEKITRLQKKVRDSCDQGDASTRAIRSPCSRAMCSHMHVPCMCTFTQGLFTPCARMAGPTRRAKSTEEGATHAPQQPTHAVLCTLTPMAYRWREPCDRAHRSRS